MSKATRATGAAITWRRGPILAAALIFVAALWLENTWSPSHYSVVLRAFGANDVGLVLGQPRGILSDEWGVITPLVQATVNNGLARFNATSPYGEDLRTVLSMPVLDWGLAFKPEKWLYPLLNAAYAFSFQWLFYLVAFVAGYALLFRRLGSGPAESLALSLALFFTAFVQIWWTIFAPTVAIFPWLILALDIANPTLRAAAIAWTGACWMLGFFYPPQFIPLALVGAALFFGLHFDRRRLASAWAPLLGAAVACAIVVFYLQDYLVATWQTVYPGNRRVHGGGLPAVMLVESIWPAAFFKTAGFAQDLEAINTPLNLAESSAVGTYYALLVLAFLDYRKAVGTTLAPSDRRLLVALATAFVALTAWQTLPIPGGLVAWTGFNRVPPQRSIYASGLALVLFLAQAARVFGLRFGWRRYVAFALLVLLGWGVTKAGAAAAHAFPDLVVLPLAAFALAPSAWLERHGRTLAAAAAALWGALTFGTFNPLQSAWPIFNREATPLTAILEDRVRRHPDHLLVSDQFGATLNGWGFRSAAHVLPMPPLAHWTALFPDIEPQERNTIFNRFAHIVPLDEARPRLIALAVAGVPWARLEDPLMGSVVRRSPAEGPPATATEGGHVDTRVVVDGKLHVFGWAPWRGLADGQRMEVFVDDSLVPVRFARIPRRDLAQALGDESAAYSGFQLVLAPVAGSDIDKAHPLCLLATGTSPAPTTLIAEDKGKCRRGAQKADAAR